MQAQQLPSSAWCSFGCTSKRVAYRFGNYVLCVLQRCGLRGSVSKTQGVTTASKRLSFNTRPERECWGSQLHSTLSCQPNFCPAPTSPNHPFVRITPARRGTDDARPYTQSWQGTEKSFPCESHPRSRASRNEAMRTRNKAKPKSRVVNLFEFQECVGFRGESSWVAWGETTTEKKSALQIS